MKHNCKKILKIFVLFLVLLSLGCGQQKKEVSQMESTKAPLERLLEGNIRFQEDHPLHPDQTLDRLRELRKGQHPFAVIVSCSDSRVPPELIFDQGLGDLFVIRNAGNLISDYELGSIEYAVEHLDTKLIVVLGHKQCGAISAFIEHKKDSVQSHIQQIIDYIKREPEELALEENVSNYYEQAINANVAHGVHVIEQSEPVLKEYLEAGKVEVYGMLYDLETGKVELIHNEK
ncbi:MAG: carbonic anhydrase [Lutimonas sp.]